MRVEVDGPKVRAMRREAGFATRAAFAEAAGLSESTVTKLEKPRAVVRLDTARKVSAVLGIDPRSVARVKGE